jgi:lipid-A-disaccharide synthase-like uncharacterized protein
MKTLRPLPQVHADLESSIARSVVDWAVYVFIVLIGAFQLVHYPHADDFLGDVTYPDLARSLLEKGAYQIRLLPQTTLPPGLPFILALVGKFFGISPAVAFGVVAVSTVMGLITAYELLRRVEGRSIAVIACLLLASCPALFGFSTDVVFPEMPYLLASMAALLLTLKIDRTQRGIRLVFWVLLLAVTLVLAVLIRSVGIALLAGLISWIAVSLLTAPKTGQSRVFKFALPLAFGLAAQLSWSIWAQHHESLEWQLPGYPGSYLSQVEVKNGQDPELGLAHVSDIPSRIGRNVVARAVGFSELLLRRNVSTFWSSPAIFGLVLVIALGLISSLRNGGQLYDWYFLWYECIFMVWPWDYRDRFVLPIVPLACLYLWRGAKTIMHYLIRRPRSVGLAFALLGTLLCICSATFALRLAAFPVNPGHVRGDHLQTIAATVLWGLLGIAGLVILKMQRDNHATFARKVRVAESVVSLPFWFVVTVGVAFLVVTGVKTIVAIGQNRANLDATKESLYPELEASDWIRTHEPPNVVLMAREPEFVFHYAHDPTVWFPPISDAKVLMDGIRRYHVEFVVVARHQPSYWLPTEVDCLQALQQAYPGVFRLSHRGPDNYVYEVEPALERN